MSKFNLARFKSNGYTLIEVLIVISIMSAMSVFAYANYQKLKESQNLKGSAADIQNLIRQAQSSAVSRLNCNGGNGASWSIVFIDSTNLTLTCQAPGGSQVTIKSLSLQNNIQINSITGTCQASYPVTITFPPISSVVSYSDTTLPTCVGSPTLSTLTISTINRNTGDIQNFKVSKGGAIDAQ